MSIAIVITLYCIAILVFGVYMIAKVHLETSRITQEKDIISKIIENREQAIRHSGSAMKINTYFAILGLSPLIVGTVVYLFSKNGLFAILMGFMGFLTPDLILYVIHGQTEKNFEERYARALDQLGSSLRAGISISTAVEDVAQCKFIHPSVRKRFAKLSADLQMGITVADAFQHFADDCGNEDAADIALAIAVQDTVGGHEADVVLSIANNIEERIMMRREIKSIFAATSAMVWMFDFIAPGTILYFCITSPSYIDTYFQDTLHILLFITILCMPLVGSFINHKTLRRVQKGV